MNQTLPRSSECITQYGIAQMVKATYAQMMDSFSQRFKNTLFLRAFSFWKIPLIWWLRPSSIEMSERRTVIQIPLRRRSKNHLGSMYFGALAVGAELVVAAKAVHAIHQSGQKIDFVFKDFFIEFAKRAEGDVHFVCEAGDQVTALVQKAIQTGERQTETYAGYAYVPRRSLEPICNFKVTLSLKLRKPDKVCHQS